MKIGMPLSYAGGFRETADRLLTEFEDVGLDLVMLAEAYSYDSVSRSATSPRAPSGSSCRRASSTSTRAARP